MLGLSPSLLLCLDAPHACLASTALSCTCTVKFLAGTTQQLQSAREACAAYTAQPCNGACQGSLCQLLARQLAACLGNRQHSGAAGMRRAKTPCSTNPAKAMLDTIGAGLQKRIGVKCLKQLLRLHAGQSSTIRICSACGPQISRTCLPAAQGNCHAPACPQRHCCPAGAPDCWPVAGHTWLGCSLQPLQTLDRQPQWQDSACVGHGCGWLQMFELCKMTVVGVSQRPQSIGRCPFCCCSCLGSS